VLASSEFTKVPCSFWDYVIVELEDDSTFGFTVDSYIELKNKFLRVILEAIDEKPTKTFDMVDKIIDGRM
jgi:hypothetical protein